MLPLFMALVTAAQQPAATAGEWLAFADSVQRIADADRLLASAESLQSRTAWAARLRAALLYHRSYEITRNPVTFDRAASLIRPALSGSPDLPVLHYLAGRVLGSVPALAERKGIIAGSVVRNATGSSDDEFAISQLNRALELDSMFLPAALEVARQSLEARDRDAIEHARRALRVAMKGSGSQEAVLLLSDLEREAGDPEAAAAVLEAPGAPRGPQADYRIARALLPLADRADEGAAAYRRGIERLDSITASLYYSDLVYLADPEERSSWEHVSLSDRKRRLTEFWSYHAAMAGLPLDQRIAVHYRRLAIARDSFPRWPGIRGRMTSRAGGGARPILMDTAAYLRDVDDRGLVYIKYGPPDHRFSSGIADAFEDSPKEAWIYERDGQSLSFYMQRDSDDGGASGFSLFSGLGSFIDCDFLQEAAQYDPELQKTTVGVCLGNVANPLRILSSTATLNDRAYRRIRRDDARPRFARELPFHYSLYTLRGDGRRSTVLAALAVPASQLTSTNDTYGFSIAFTIADTITRSVSRVDTTITVRPGRALGPLDYVRVYLQLDAEPSTAAVHRIGVTDANETSAGKIYGGPRRIRAYPEGTLGISDLILAAPNASGGWQRGGAALDVVPMDEYPGGAFNLFYEVYDARPGPYRTEIVIEPVDSRTRQLLRRITGDRAARIALSFDGEAGPGDRVLQEIRRVDSQLPEGEYRITVRVRDASDAMVESSRKLRITGHT